MLKFTAPKVGQTFEVLWKLHIYLDSKDLFHTNSVCCAEFLRSFHLSDEYVFCIYTYLFLDFRLFQLPCHGIAAHRRPVNARPWPSRQTNNNSSRIFNMLENDLEVLRVVLVRFRMQLQSGASCRIVSFRVVSCRFVPRLASHGRPKQAVQLKIYL